MKDLHTEHLHPFSHSDTPETMIGIADAAGLFSIQDFLKNYKLKDALDEALQPVFKILAQDFPGHRLTVTAAGATLEKHEEISSYANIDAMRAMYADPESPLCKMIDEMINTTLPAALHERG